MRRIIFIFVAACTILNTAAAAAAFGPGQNPVETSITCDEVGAHTGRLYRTLFGRHADNEGLAYWVGQRRAGLSGEDVAYWMTSGPEYHQRYGTMNDGQFIHAVYQNLLGRPADAEGHSYWLGLVGLAGRHSVVSWMTQTPEYAHVWPYRTSSICDKAAELGLRQSVPGIVEGQSGSTVTVIADRALVDLTAVEGTRTHAGSIEGDVVVNANWFTASGSQGPVVIDGNLSGSGDIIERGQLLVNRPECSAPSERLQHIWMGEIYTPGPCVETAVSGISLVHQGVRADAFPGINLTSGYTNTSPAHSFIGFNEDEIIIVSTYQMTASQLADYAISLGVVEGVMLDGGGSTQIATPSAWLSTSRAVPTFAVLNSLVG